MAELPLPEKGQQISEHSDPPKASPGLPEPPPSAAPENAARCTCATDGNASRCSFHTQADYDAAGPRAWIDHGHCNDRYFYMLGERDRWERRYYDIGSKLYATRLCLVLALLAVVGLVLEVTRG